MYHSLDSDFLTNEESKSIDNDLQEDNVFSSDKPFKHNIINCPPKYLSKPNFEISNDIYKLTFRNGKIIGMNRVEKNENGYKIIY